MKGFLKGTWPLIKGVKFFTPFIGVNSPLVIVSKKDPKKPKIQSSASSISDPFKVGPKKLVHRTLNGEKMGPFFFTSQKWVEFVGLRNPGLGKTMGRSQASWNREGGPIDLMTADLHTSSKNPEKPYGFHTFLKDPWGGKKNGNKKSRQILPWKFAEKVTPVEQKCS